MNFTKRELATILSGLRFWQCRYRISLEEAAYLERIANIDQEVDALTPVEIDYLCERLNFEAQKLE